MGRCASYHFLAVPGELDTAYAGVEGCNAKAECPATRVVDSDIGPSLGCRELVRIVEVDPETRRGVLARNSVNCSSHDIHRYVWQVRSQSIAIQCGAICVWSITPATLCHDLCISFERRTR